MGEITTKVSHQPDSDVQPKEQQVNNSELLVKILSILLPILQGKKGKITSDFSEFMEQVEKLLKEKEYSNEIEKLYKQLYR